MKHNGSNIYRENLSNKESGWVTKMRHLLDACGMPNLILNIFKVLNSEIDKKEYKNKHKFFQKELRIQVSKGVASKSSFTFLKMKITTFFHKQKNSLKRKDI